VINHHSSITLYWEVCYQKIGSWWQKLISRLRKQSAMPEQPLKRSRIQVGTDLNALAEVLQWFEQFNISLVPGEIWWQCQTALAEGFTNAVRHAHHNLPPETSIDIEVAILPHCLEMRIWDDGQPFDLESKLQALSQQVLDPLEKENGRGLIFMHQLTDEISYTRTEDQRNCLLMRRNLLRPLRGDK